MSDAAARRRVLIVGRDYFFYTREIAVEMRAAFGTDVTYLPITPPGTPYRVVEKARPALARRWLERYHRAAIARLRGQRFDEVLFIQVHQVGDLAGEYRAAFPGARFLLYYWDSLRTHDYLPFARHFDEVVSFDRGDVQRHPQLRYLPLFYSERFRALRSRREFAWDLSFVGIASSMGRYEQLADFEAWARRNGLRFQKYLVVSPLFFVRMLLQGRLLRGIRFRALAPEQVLAVYDTARTIVDLPNNRQTGLTMRTFEALGAHRKLITTNEAILKDDFHTPQSVFVITPQAQYPNLSFVTTPGEFSPAVERYSLRAWIAALMGWPAPGARP